MEQNTQKCTCDCAELLQSAIDFMQISFDASCRTIEQLMKTRNDIEDRKYKLLSMESEAMLKHISRLYSLYIFLCIVLVICINRLK